MNRSILRRHGVIFSKGKPWQTQRKAMVTELAKVWQHGTYLEDSVSTALENMFTSIEEAKELDQDVDVEQTLEAGLNEIILYLVCKPSECFMEESQISSAFDS